MATTCMIRNKTRNASTHQPKPDVYGDLSREKKSKNLKFVVFKQGKITLMYPDFYFNYKFDPWF